MSRLLIASFLLAVQLIITSSALADRKVYKIASDSILEGYYSIGLKVCTFLKKSEAGCGCLVIPTTGGIETINKLRSGEVDFGFIQQNLALDAYHGKGAFVQQKPMKELIQLLHLHDDVFTVIVKADRNITTFKDLDGKRISNGSPISDSSITYSELISDMAFKAQPEDIELSHEEYAEKLCSGQIDAVIIMTGHPNVLVSHITGSCKTKFLELEQENIERLTIRNRSFKRLLISGSDYQLPQAVTIAVPALFVTTTKTEPDVVARLLRVIRKNIQSLKLSHPTLYNLPHEHFENGFVLPSAGMVKE